MICTELKSFGGGSVPVQILRGKTFQGGPIIGHRRIKRRANDNPCHALNC